MAGTREALRFEPKALDLIFMYCCGIPRLVNIICDFILLAAYAEEVRDVDEAMIYDIVGDLDFDSHYWAQEQPEGAEGAAPVAPRPPRPLPVWSESRIEDGFSRLNQRIGAFENEALAATQVPLKELSERLEQMQDVLTQQLCRTNAAVAELNKKIEVQPEQDPVQQDPERHEPVKREPVKCESEPEEPEKQEPPEKTVPAKLSLMQRLFG